MWPFKKKTNLPGFNRNSNGDLIFNLTEEEEQEVQSAFSLFENFAVRPDVAQELQQGITAYGLFNYTQTQIMYSEFESYKEERKELINKAIASITKAYTFCPLPIYVYDLACYTEKAGHDKQAKELYQKFIELQTNFRPSQIQEILLNVNPRDINEAINVAVNRVKG